MSKLKELEIKLFLGDTILYEGVANQECYYMASQGRLSVYYLQRRPFSDTLFLINNQADITFTNQKCSGFDQELYRNDIYRIAVAMQVLKVVMDLLSQ